MRVASVRFTPWTKPYYFDAKQFDLEIGNFVIVKTDSGMEIGKVVEITEREKTEEELSPIIRKANQGDLDQIKGKEKEKKEVLDYCKTVIDKYGLEMKLVDVHFSYDGGRITFAFIAEGRIDFRELVKELTRYFQKSIRLHQIGIRDEAKFMGDTGVCGQSLCCRRFLKDLKSITSDMAEDQQVAHRGSERLSGICGRLMCCLAYEEDNYKKLINHLPPLGSKMKTERGMGVVIGWHTLKQTVDVDLGDKNIIEVILK